MNIKKLTSGIFMIIGNIGFFYFIYYALQISDNYSLKVGGFILAFIYMGSIAFGVYGVGPLGSVFRKSAKNKSEKEGKELSIKRPWE